MSYMPVWGGAFEGYSRNFVRSNFWRVRYIMTEEDAVQYCAEAFARCLRYCEARGGQVNNPAWFIGILKLAIYNDFNTLARQCGNIRAGDDAGGQDREWSGDVEVAHSDGPMSAALAGASVELREVIRAVATAPVDLLSLLLQEASDAKWSRRLCRLTRIGRLSDTIVSELRGILMPETARGWVTNGEMNRLVYLSDTVPEGWSPGRKRRAR